MPDVERPQDGERVAGHGQDGERVPGRRLLGRMERRVFDRLARRVSPSIEYHPGLLVGVLSRVSPVRTVYYSLRHRAPVVVARRVSVRCAGAGRLHIRPGGMLLAGLQPEKRSATSVLVADGGVLSVEGRVTVLAGATLEVRSGAVLAIGDKTFLNADASVVCGREVRIGARCAVASRVAISDTDVHQLFAEGRPVPNVAPVRIGDRVWIGAGAAVLKGVVVGDGAVIGAGSVVTRSVPPGVVAAGNPARVVREGVTWRF